MTSRWPAKPGSRSEHTCPDLSTFYSSLVEGLFWAPLFGEFRPRDFRRASGRFLAPRIRPPFFLQKPSNGYDTADFLLVQAGRSILRAALRPALQAAVRDDHGGRLGDRGHPSILCTLPSPLRFEEAV